jgi:hypothetical protein
MTSPSSFLALARGAAVGDIDDLDVFVDVAIERGLLLSLRPIATLDRDALRGHARAAAVRALRDVGVVVTIGISTDSQAHRQVPAGELVVVDAATERRLRNLDVFQFPWRTCTSLIDFMADDDRDARALRELRLDSWPITDVEIQALGIVNSVVIGMQAEKQIAAAVRDIDQWAAGPVPSAPHRGGFGSTPRNMRTKLRPWER